MEPPATAFSHVRWLGVTLGLSRSSPRPGNLPVLTSCHSAHFAKLTGSFVYTTLCHGFLSPPRSLRLSSPPLLSPSFSHPGFCCFPKYSTCLLASEPHSAPPATPRPLADSSSGVRVGIGSRGRPQSAVLGGGSSPVRALTPSSSCSMIATGPSPF